MKSYMKLVRTGCILIALSFPAVASIASGMEGDFARFIGGAAYLLFYFCSFIIATIGLSFIVFGFAITMYGYFRAEKANLIDD